MQNKEIKVGAGPGNGLRAWGGGTSWPQGGLRDGKKWVRMVKTRLIPLWTAPFMSGWGELSRANIQGIQGCLPHVKTFERELTEKGAPGRNIWSLARTGLKVLNPESTSS